MKRILPVMNLLLVSGLVAVSCSPSAAETPETTLPTTTTTTTPPITAASSSTTTTTEPVIRVQVEGELQDDLLAVVATFLSWQIDDRNHPPKIPKGLEAHLANHPIATTDDVEVTGTTAEVEGGEVGVVLTEGGDVLLAADEGSGWQIVGARPANDAAWYGDEPRVVMVIGSDARVGTNQQTHRADSIHLLTANPSQGTGTILGFPRDSWVSTKHGTMKFSSLMSGRGPQVMVDQVVDTWDLPVEGYVVTGFEGFEDLMGKVGYLPIDLPRAIPNQAWWNGWPAGEQTLSPQRALEYSRTRKGIPGGDLTRSANQGLVMLAVLHLLQMNDIVDTPEIVKLLLDYTWTSLTPTDLIQLGAAVHTLDPEAIDNIVLPGNPGWAGSASVVRLTSEADEMLDDLRDDGLVEVASSE
ncbi:MAG: LCP family protein [Acidimicrobiia bacterium]